MDQILSFVPEEAKKPVNKLLENSKISIKILNQLDPKKKIRMDKTVIDKISASLILESYLNRITK